MISLITITDDHSSTCSDLAPFFLLCYASIDHMLGCLRDLSYFSFFECIFDEVRELFLEEFFVGLLCSVDLCIESENTFVSDDGAIGIDTALSEGLRKRCAFHDISIQLHFGFALVDVLTSRSAASCKLEIDLLVSDGIDKSLYLCFSVSV
jgi:hypothetical protein